MPLVLVAVIQVAMDGAVVECFIDLLLRLILGDRPHSAFVRLPIATAYSLQKAVNRRRRLSEHDGVDVADVDSKLQRRGGYAECTRIPP